MSRPSPLLPVLLLAAASGARAQAPAAPSAVDAVRAALASRPADCDALKSAFARLAQEGRKPGDVEVVASARRSEAECAAEAGNAAAQALGIKNGEIVEWLLRHPQATASAVDLKPKADDEPGQPLPCGLALVGRRFRQVAADTGSGLVLTLRNDTGRALRGCDIIARVGGQPWRGGFKPPARSGAGMLPDAEYPLSWDTARQSWVTNSTVESETLRVGRHGKAVTPPEVPPGERFELLVPMTGVPASARAEDVEITVDTCMPTFD